MERQKFTKIMDLSERMYLQSRGEERRQREREREEQRGQTYEMSINDRLTD